MNHYKSFYIVIALFVYNQSFSQSYIGHNVDNYAGIHSVAYNPSTIVGSNFKTDINIISGSVFGGSDYFGIDFNSLINGNFDFDDDSERYVSEGNNFYLNTNVLGPSFMFNLNKKSSIGIITKGRAFFNLNDINGELFEAIEDEFESDNNVTFNSQRGNKLFADGSGNAGDVSGKWFPGDEWKGDVARMMMYMYLRYGNQCLPKNVIVGDINSSDNNMIDLLLQWNIDDPVSDFEKNRNNVVKGAQGNRNPIIDNPYLATVIWGGADAVNTWK